MAYYRRLLHRAWDETKTVWTVYRWWAVFAAAIAAALSQAMRGSNINVHDLLISAFMGGGIAFGGSLLISLFRAPILIDGERMGAINRLTPPSIELHRREMVSELLRLYSAEGRACLRYILLNGDTYVITLGQHVAAAGVKEVGMKSFSQGERLIIPGNSGCWTVNPELKESLVFHLLGTVTPPSA